MRKTLKIMLLGLLAFSLLTGAALANSYPYNTDNFANWPGWYIDSRDVIGEPSETAMTVNTNNEGFLDSIVINMTDRRTPDGLFINSDWDGTYNDYQTWNYYITGGVLYNVSNTFNPLTDYDLATNPGGWSGRWGHPAGINSDFLTADTYGFLPTSGVVYNGTTLTYTFDIKSSDPKGISIGNEGTFVIGYSEWCANDVFLTPVGVPEPGVLLLLGLGLVGVGLVKRKME